MKISNFGKILIFIFPVMVALIAMDHTPAQIPGKNASTRDPVRKTHATENYKPGIKTTVNRHCRHHLVKDTS